MTSEQLSLAACGLCAEMGDVERRPTTWTDEAVAELGLPGPWAVVERCRDEQACRGRVEQVLEVAWPLRDRTVPTVRPGMGGRSSESAAGLGPHGSRALGATGSKVSAPAADEDIEWLR